MTWKKILAREYGVQYTELSLNCLSPMNRAIVPMSFYEQIYIPEDGNEACYIDEDRWEEFVSALEEKYLKNPSNYEEFERLFMKTGNDYMNIAREISKSNLKEKTSHELAEMYLDYLTANIKYGPFIWMQFIINNQFSDKVKDILSGKIGDGNLNDWIEVALRPDKKAAAIKLGELAAGWKELSDKEKEMAWEEFRWVPCLDIHNRPWKKEEFFSHIGDFKKVERKLPITYEELMRKVDPSPREKQILEIGKKLTYLKDLKDDLRRQGVFYGQRLFEEIAGRMVISLEETSYLLTSEILDFLDNGKKISKGIIQDRKIGFAIYFTRDGKIACKTGDEIGQVLKGLGLTGLEETSSEIRGIPASSGKVQGMVKIVKGVADLVKVNQGDILVAVATHPDYVMVMHRASAVVTDEGGITSHAAIVSRELGIPCVVGTKNATQILKDGDMVDVNADTGIIRKIK